MQNLIDKKLKEQIKKLEVEKESFKQDNDRVTNKLIELQATFQM